MNSSVKCALTLSKAERRRSRPSLFKLWMAWRNGGWPPSGPHVRRRDLLSPSPASVSSSSARRLTAPGVRDPASGPQGAFRRRPPGEVRRSGRSQRAREVRRARNRAPRRYDARFRRGAPPAASIRASARAFCSRAALIASRAARAARSASRGPSPAAARRSAASLRAGFGRVELIHQRAPGSRGTRPAHRPVSCSAVASAICRSKALIWPPAPSLRVIHEARSPAIARAFSRAPAPRADGPAIRRGPLRRRRARGPRGRGRLQAALSGRRGRPDRRARLAPPRIFPAPRRGRRCRRCMASSSAESRAAAAASARSAALCFSRAVSTSRKAPLWLRRASLSAAAQAAA